MRWYDLIKRIALTVFAAAFPASALAQGPGYYGGWHMGPGMMYGGWGYGGGWFSFLFMAVFWVLIVIGLVFLIRWLIQASSGGRLSHFGGQTGGSKALDILRERYAKGEIDKEHYEAMKRDISG